ncbi:Serine threonine kinase [Octopus vulgaris]|uniref:non-specific serine/threonine protein kinase n=1 Tax=Octopus vulgaris TaxID=6645 RepID=A0AA36BW00_OCTVU|nr:Serine threonine kinase [Octopus vulgaris]
MPSLPKPGSLKDPETAALFSLEDPEKVFTELREIGHGSFGAVYFAKNLITKEIVAIKKMSFSGKSSAEKWQDIVKEVKFLRDLKHRNIIDFKGCYLREHTTWLVMEYCLGSAADIIEVHKKPLKQVEISAICHDALEGMHYLHSQGKIHRDIKAGNILLRENGLVKLADFGSASMTSPANSFVGTPYWMAPEVILAMDEGQYEGTADIWSLGITCIELAERKPPLFNMNAMSALYHIAQNDSPTLSPGDWSESFHDFVDSCLAKCPADRPSAQKLLFHQFVNTPRSNTVILDLIFRTKDAVRELDNLQYRRMKKILMVENNDDEAKNSTGEPSADDSSQDDDTLIDSSKSNSIASHQSGISTSSRSSSMNSLPGPSVDDNHFSFSRDHSPPRALQTHLQPSRSLEPGAGNFATIRTTSIVTKQMKEHEHTNELREQFAGYKRMRKQHQKQLKTMESKFAAEMEEHKLKLDKEYDLLKVNFGKELERLSIKHAQELEKRQRNNTNQEKKLFKQIQQSQEEEMKNFTAQQRREYKQNKEQMKKDIDNSTPKKVREESIRSQKESLQQKQKEEEDKLDRKHKNSRDGEVRMFRRRKLLLTHQLQTDLLKEELSKQKAHLDLEHNMLLRHHESTQEIEFRHLSSLQKLREDQMKKQHQTELTNQTEYSTNAEQDLRKKHASEVKQQPRSLRQKELQIRKQFREAVKTQERQYKALKEHILQNVPKNEQKGVVKKLKEEQRRKLAILGEQYEQSIAEMLQQQNIRLDETQLSEASELKQRLSQELELLIAYQSKIKMQIEAQHSQERKQLEERVSLRRALLGQKMDAVLNKFSTEQTERLQHLQEMQKKEIEDFDLETVNLGLDGLDIKQASQDTMHADDVSIRGSVISLTASSSTSSFTSHTQL